MKTSHTPNVVIFIKPSPKSCKIIASLVCFFTCVKSALRTAALGYRYLQLPPLSRWKRWLDRNGDNAMSNGKKPLDTRTDGQKLLHGILKGLMIGAGFALVINALLDMSK